MQFQLTPKEEGKRKFLFGPGRSKTPWSRILAVANIFKKAESWDRKGREEGSRTMEEETKFLICCSKWEQMFL